MSAENVPFDYSQTLFLPETPFPMRAGLPAKEPEILARWEKLGLYGRLREAALLAWRRYETALARAAVGVDPGTHVLPGTAEISKADFEASIERTIGFTIPYDAKAAANAAKLGQTFADANRSTRAGTVIREIAKSVHGVSDGEAVEDAVKARSSLLGKLDLKALLPKKTAKQSVQS